MGRLDEGRVEPGIQAAHAVLALVGLALLVVLRMQQVGLHELRALGLEFCQGRLDVGRGAHRMEGVALEGLARLLLAGEARQEAVEADRMTAVARQAAHRERRIDRVLAVHQGACLGGEGAAAVGVLHIEDAVGQVLIAHHPGHLRRVDVVVVGLAEGRDNVGAVEINRPGARGRLHEDAAAHIVVSRDEALRSPPQGAGEAQGFFRFGRRGADNRQSRRHGHGRPYCPFHRPALPLLTADS